MEKLRILVAYPYMNAEVIKFLDERKDSIMFLLDSGAFTAWKAKKEIRVEDYITFIKSLPIKPWRYFNLDKIGDPKGTHENYLKMLDAGLKPLPVFTRGEDVSMIDEYYKTSDVLGVGGLVNTKGSRGYVKGIMEHIGSRKVHWLGFTNSSFVNAYKPYMCDCSSWSYATRYGDLIIYAGGGKVEGYHRTVFKKRPPPKLYNLIKSYGIDPAILSKEESWRSSFVHDFAAQCWVRRSLESHKKLGTDMFLACASISDLKAMWAGFEKEMSLR